MNKNKINIISIEDNLGDLILLDEILKESSETEYVLTNFPGLKDALDYLENGACDIILLDLSLPDSKGLKSLEKIRMVNDVKPVIVMTGNDDQELAKKAIHSGAQDYLVKGNFNFSLISRAISYAIERKNLESKIKESEKLYRGLIELSPSAIFIYVDGIIRYVNSAALHLLGAGDKKEVLGKDILLFVDPSYHQAVNERRKEIESGKRSELVEEKILRLDGTKVDVELMAAPITFKNKNAVQVVVRDITEKKQATEKYIQQSNLNAQMAELAGNLLKARTIENITELTLAQAKRLTNSKFGFVGYIDPKTGFMVVPTLSRDIWNECQVEKKTIVFEKFTGLWGWVLVNKQSLISNQPGKDYRSIGTPKGHIKIERIISVPATHDNRLVGGITIANSPEDYTENDLVLIERLASVFALGLRRIQAVDQVIEQQERFRLAFQYSNIGSIIAGLDKKLIKVNSTFPLMLGYTEDEILDKTFDDITYFEDIEIGQKEYRQMLDGEIDFTVNQKRYVHKNGRIIRAIVSSTLLRDSKNEPLYFITHIQDFTEKLEAEEKLRESLTEKEALIKELFHRTKNNMQVICSMMKLKAISMQDKQVVDAFNEMQNRIQSISLVHEKLLKYGNLSRIDLKDYIDDLSMLLYMRYNISSGKIDLKLELNSATVLFDTAIPCGLLVNELLSNAFKYAFPGEMKGEITVSLKQLEDDYIELKVSDNGVGLETDILDAGKNSFGLKLVNSIAESQLQGEVVCSRENGFSYCVKFRDEYYSERVKN